MTKLSEIPSFQDINSINYLLLVIKNLSDKDNSCFLDSVETICLSNIFGGKPIDFKRLLELSKQLNLVSHKKKVVSLNIAGQEFVLLNQDNTYEISQGQAGYIIENFVFNGLWKSNSRGFFQNFSPNYKLVTFDLVVRENPLPKRYIPVFSLLKRLEIVEVKDGTISVKPLYVRYVKELLSSKKLSHEELKKLLEADEQLGLLAEEAVLVFERKRLEQLGRLLEADLVRKIGQLDVIAGYDIESFNGDTPELNPNRFIEVKASKQNRIRFFWSINEYEKAKELRDNYWIYFVGGFNETNKLKVNPIMIQNPVKFIAEGKILKLNISKYLVDEI